MKTPDDTSPAAEFSRPLLVDRVPKLGSTEVIAAEAAELTSLARRLGIPALHALRAKIRATPWRGGGIKLDGTIAADLDQVSVVSLETFRQTLELPLQRYFLPSRAVVQPEEDDVDVIEHGVIDLGEVATETLALELDPYPRKPGESFADHLEDDDTGPELESPFAALGKLPKTST